MASCRAETCSDTHAGGSSRSDRNEGGGGGGGGTSVSASSMHAPSSATTETSVRSKAFAEHTSAVDALEPKSEAELGKRAAEAVSIEPKTAESKEEAKAETSTECRSTKGDLLDGARSLLETCVDLAQSVWAWLGSATHPSCGYVRVLGPRSVTAHEMGDGRLVIVFGEERDKQVPETKQESDIVTFVEYAENLAREHPGRTFRVFMEARYPDGVAPIDFRLHSEEAYDAGTIGRVWERCMINESGLRYGRIGLETTCKAPENLRVQATDVRGTVEFASLTSAVSEVIKEHECHLFSLSSSCPTEDATKEALSQIRTEVKNVTADTGGKLWDAMDRSADFTIRLGHVSDTKWKARLAEEAKSLQARFDTIENSLAESDKIRSYSDLYSKIAIPMIRTLGDAQSLLTEMEMARSKDDVCISYGREGHANHQRAFLRDVGRPPFLDTHKGLGATYVDMPSCLPWSYKPVGHH